MCGIVGYWNPARPGTGAGRHLPRMMDQIDHRGPDSRGDHTDESLGLAMGHTRLSIIDLEGGAQPLYLPESDLVLTANGEIYDYKRKRAELIRTGSHFRTHSDSEVALHLYQRHGLDFARYLRGELALALFDQRRQRLVLVRDRFGIKPLYFHVNGEAVYWGSEAKGMLVHPDVPCELSPESSLAQMMNLSIPGSSLFKGVQQVEPGCMLVVERRGKRLQTSQHRYWDLDFPARGEHTAQGAEELTMEVGERLIDAVATRLEADVPVACYLSGGIDSSSILGIASGYQQSPVKAFTISFDDDDYDEADTAVRMAKAVGADHTVLNLRADDLYGDAYVQAVRHAERAFYNPFGVAKYHMSQTVRDHGYKVVVTGEGADELFGGYPFFKQDMQRHGAEHETEGLGEVHESNALFSGATIERRSVAHEAFDRLLGHTPAWIQPWLRTLEMARPLLRSSRQSELCNYDPVAHLTESLDFAQLEGRHPLDQAQYTYAKTLMESQVLGWSGDRMDMAHGMEARPAFLDHYLAELAVRIPPDLRIHKGTEKWVLREAMRKMLPRELYEREKFAFMAPPSNNDVAGEEKVGDLVDAFLTPDVVERAGLFDPDRVSEFLGGRNASRGTPTGRRNDILLNHLLGLHVVHVEIVEASSRIAERAAA